MRLHRLARKMRCALPLAVVLSVNMPIQAQFRELQEGGSSSPSAPLDLFPTKEPFSAPRQSSPPPSQPTPAGPSTVDLPPVVDAASLTPPASVQLSPTQAAAGGSVGVANAGPGPVPTSPVTAAPQLGTSANPFAAFKSASPAGAPASDVAPQPPAVPQAVAFNEIVPGTTTAAELESNWGPPSTTNALPNSQLLTYHAPGFQQVDVEVNSITRVVDSIVIHLEAPAGNAQVAGQLGLASIRPVAIQDERGTVLGQGYPERGVLLNWAETSEQVTQIVLEPISGDLFRLRAELDRDNHCEQSIADLKQAAQLNPADAKAHWMLAELLSAVGRFQDARESAATALKLDPNNPLYQLTNARIVSENGELNQALISTRAVAEWPMQSTLIKARAEYQWGNLLAVGPEPKMAEALSHHLKAIELASKHISEKHVESRRMAKDILVDAHLAVAQDVALGNFQRQREVIPKWLNRAKELAEEQVKKDQADPTIRMEVYRTTLAVYSILDGNFDSASTTEDAIQEGQRLVAQSSDRLYQQRVERELSELLYHAAKIEQRCGRMTTAMQFVSNAVVLAESSQQNRQLSMFDRVMNGQLYFLTGSLYAVINEDHAEAVKWYEKAIPSFDDEHLPELVDSSVFGDLFVSMGVSFWEAGQKDKAIELTQAGAELMQQGVQSGSLDMSVLTVPYGNLAAMHKQLGNIDQAQHYATLLAKIENESSTSRR